MVSAQPSFSSFFISLQIKKCNAGFFVYYVLHTESTYMSLKKWFQMYNYGKIGHGDFKCYVETMKTLITYFENALP